MPSVRLFIAIDTPAGVRPGAVALRDQLRASEADVKWESDDKLHCTIKFLGDTPAEQVTAVSAILREIASKTPPFDVRYRGLGCFPDRRDPRVIWIGVENPGGALQQIHEQIEAALEPLGFQKEQRAFHAHLTLGRVRSRRNLRNLLAMLETVTFESEPATIREVELIRSDLKPGGSLYTVLKSHPLSP